MDGKKEKNRGYLMMGIRHALLAAIVVTPAVAAAATAAQINNARALSLAWLYIHQNPDGSWQTAKGFKVQAATLAMDALANAGLKYAYPYAQAWLTNVLTFSNDSLSRQIVAVAHSGANAAALLTQRLIAQRNDNSKSWGVYAKYQGGFPDTALGRTCTASRGWALLQGWPEKSQAIRRSWPARSVRRSPPGIPPGEYRAVES